MRVAVIGAGIIGAACAYELSQRGAEVMMIDKTGIAAETSSRCEGNLLVSDKGPGSEADLAQASNLMWRTLAPLLDDEGADRWPSTEFEAKGGIVVAFSGSEEGLRRFAAAQRTIGVRAEELDEHQLREAEPHLSPAVSIGVFYPDDAQLQPSLATQALAAAAQSRGARLIIATVTGATTVLGHITGVTTSEGTFAVDAIVNCTGPWAGVTAALLGGSAPIKPRRGMILVTTPMPQRVFHKVYDADYVGAVASDDAALQTSSVVESTPAGSVLIGSSRERVGFTETETHPAVAEIAAKAIRLFPFLADTVLMRTYGGFRPYAPDHLPLIGPDAEVSGLFHASGHEGAGIGLAPATAQLVAHHVLGTATELDVDAFLLTRAGLDDPE